MRGCEFVDPRPEMIDPRRATIGEEFERADPVGSSSAQERVGNSIEYRANGELGVGNSPATCARSAVRFGR